MPLPVGFDEQALLFWGVTPEQIALMKADVPAASTQNGQSAPPSAPPAPPAPSQQGAAVSQAPVATPAEPVTTGQPFSPSPGQAPSGQAVTPSPTPQAPAPVGAVVASDADVQALITWYRDSTSVTLTPEQAMAALANPQLMESYRSMGFGGSQQPAGLTTIVEKWLKDTGNTFTQLHGASAWDELRSLIGTRVSDIGSLARDQQQAALDGLDKLIKEQYADRALDADYLERQRQFQKYADQTFLLPFGTGKLQDTVTKQAIAENLGAWWQEYEQWYQGQIWAGQYPGSRAIGTFFEAKAGSLLTDLRPDMRSWEKDAIDTNALLYRAVTTTIAETKRGDQADAAYRQYKTTVEGALLAALNALDPFDPEDMDAWQGLNTLRQITLQDPMRKESFVSAVALGQPLDAVSYFEAIFGPEAARALSGTPYQYMGLGLVGKSVALTKKATKVAADLEKKTADAAQQKTNYQVLADDYLFKRGFEVAQAMPSTFEDAYTQMGGDVIRALAHYKAVVDSVEAALVTKQKTMAGTNQEVADALAAARLHPDSPLGQQFAALAGQAKGGGTQYAGGAYYLLSNSPFLQQLFGSQAAAAAKITEALGNNPANFASALADMVEWETVGRPKRDKEEADKQAEIQKKEALRQQQMQQGRQNFVTVQGARIGNLTPQERAYMEITADQAYDLVGGDEPSATSLVTYYINRAISKAKVDVDAAEAVRRQAAANASRQPAPGTGNPLIPTATPVAVAPPSGQVGPPGMFDEDEPPPGGPPPPPVRRLN